MCRRGPAESAYSPTPIESLRPLSPSGYLSGLVVVIGLGSLLTVVRALDRKEERQTDSKGGKPMKLLTTLLAGSLETVWAAAAGALQAPKG